MLDTEVSEDSLRVKVALLVGRCIVGMLECLALPNAGGSGGTGLYAYLSSEGTRSDGETEDPTWLR